MPLLLQMPNTSASGFAASCQFRRFVRQENRLWTKPTAANGTGRQNDHELVLAGQTFSFSLSDQMVVASLLFVWMFMTICPFTRLVLHVAPGGAGITHFRFPAWCPSTQARSPGCLFLWRRT